MPLIFDTQTTNLNVISAQCLTMNDVSYNIKATTTPIASSWVLDNQGALVTSSNFSFSQIKIAVSSSSKPSLPSWFSWNSTTRTFTIVSNNNADSGSYSFEFKLTSTLHEGWSCMIKMTTVLQFDKTVNAIPNLNKIQFVTPLVNAFNVETGVEWRYSLPKTTYLVLSKDLNEQDISISVTAPSLILYSSSQNQLFTTRAFTENDKGTIKININLYDTKGMSSKFTITIQVATPNVVTSVPSSSQTEPTISPQIETLNPSQSSTAQPEQNSNLPIQPVNDTTQSIQNLEQAARVEEAKQLAGQAVKSLNAQVSSVSTWDGWKVLLKSLENKTKSETKLDSSNLKQTQMSIQSISNLGRIKIKFSQPMKVPSGFKRQSRLLRSIDEAIQIRLQTENQLNIHFSWNITEFKEDEMEIQLNFTDAGSVSTISPDVLIIQVVDPSFFIDQTGQMISSFIIATQIPRQIQMGSIDEAVTNMATSAGNGAKGFVVTNFFLSLMLSASLNQMWSMVEAQQIIVMFPLFNIQIPATPAVVIGKFLEIANFDVIPMQNIWSKIFYMPPSQTLSQRFVAVGIQDSQFVRNLGSMFLSVLLVQILILIAYLIQLLKKTKSSRVKSMWNKIEPLAFWNFPTQTFMETFMMIALCSMLTIKYPNWLSYGQKIDTVLAYVFGSLSLTFLVGSTIIMITEYKRQQMIESDQDEINDKKKISDIQRKFKPLYEELDLQNPWIPLFRFVFLFRRLVLAIAVVLLNKLIIQLFLGYFQSVLMIITIGMANPYKEYSKHRKELINEAIIMSSLYFVMCFSDFVPDIFAQNIVGYIFCGMIALHTVVNILLIVITSIISYIHRIRRYFFIRKHKQMALQTRNLIDRQKLKRHILELGSNRNKAFENSLEKSLSKIERAVLAQYIQEHKVSGSTKIDHKLLKKITRTVTKMAHELDIIDEEGDDCLAEVLEEEEKQEDQMQDNRDVNQEYNHSEINRSFLEYGDNPKEQNYAGSVLTQVVQEQVEIVKIQSQENQAIRNNSDFTIKENNSQVDDKFIISGCKKISTLEPEPEEQIIDSSSKSKAVLIQELEEFIDTWDIEEPEEHEHSYGLDYFQKDSQRQSFIIDQQLSSIDDGITSQKRALNSFSLARIAEEITYSKATQINFKEIHREHLQQQIDQEQQTNDIISQKKKTWGLATLASINFGKKRQVLTRKIRK